MLLWIIRDGEKTGPFEDYEIREMIREGKVARETRVWHEGADKWISACDVGVLAGEFVKEEVEPPPIPIVISPFQAWRRLGARVFDYLLYQLILVTILRIIGMPLNSSPADGPSAWDLIAVLIPVILMEAALLSAFGFTPGKWLMSLRVENIKANFLPTSHALIRSLRVWVLGMGMMHPILLLLGHAITLWFGLKKGAPLWDLHSGFRVVGSKLSGQRIACYWGCLVLVFVLMTVVMWPEIQPMWEESIRQVEEDMRRQGK